MLLSFPGIGANIIEAAMKELATTHKKELEHYTDLDLTAIERITYLHDFDREVQYVLLVCNWARSGLTVLADVRRGDTLPSMRITVTLHPQMPCYRSGFPL